MNLQILQDARVSSRSTRVLRIDISVLICVSGYILISAGELALVYMLILTPDFILFYF